MYEESIQREVQKGRFETARELQSKAINICEEMRKLWFSKKHRYTSQRQEQIKQLFEELAISLQKLPHQIASERGCVEQDSKSKSEKEFYGKIYTIVKISDNQRYKMMGNAVTTNVMECVARRILESLNYEEDENN
jgi:site-specific DNA-cytosine methylase